MTDSAVLDSPIVMVEWVDSFGVSPDWGELSNAEDRYPPVCRSVGWLIVDGDNVKVVVPHIHESDDEIGAVESGCGEMTIPVQAVKRITRLYFEGCYEKGKGKAD